MINPYSGINWNTIKSVSSCSHAHCDTQEQFDFVKQNYEHFALSNYYPSKPFYPLKNCFTDIPSGKIASPNAEHFQIKVGGIIFGGLHMSSLGSTYASGNPQPILPHGFDGEWQVLINNIINKLQYPTGGGVTINHPKWSNLPVDLSMAFLDYDYRVLGIEIFNATSEYSKGNGWALDYWDEILKTGRRCWGFCVPDHDAKNKFNCLGRNILLVDNKTEKDCLEAYRNGTFYGKYGNSDLSFLKIGINGKNLTAEINKHAHIKVIIDGQNYEYDGISVSHPVPNNTTYARIEAVSEDDRIFSNPIIFNPLKNKKTNNLLWF